MNMKRSAHQRFSQRCNHSAKALAECLSRQSQDLGRLELIGAGELQDGREKNAIDFELGLGIQVRAPRLEASADEGS